MYRINIRTEDSYETWQNKTFKTKLMAERRAKILAESKSVEMGYNHMGILVIKPITAVLDVTVQEIKNVS